MTVSSLLAETQIFVVLALWPKTTAVIAARWFDKARRGSCVSFAVKDSTRGIDHTLIFESSDPVSRCCGVAATQEIGWRWAAEVETCLPVQICKSQYSRPKMMKGIHASHNITLPSAVPRTKTVSAIRARLCILSGNETKAS